MELEEVLIGAVKIPQGFLKCHRIDFFQPCRFFPLLEVGEKLARLDIGHRFMVCLPLVTADGEEMVVHESGAAERPMNEAYVSMRSLPLRCFLAFDVLLDNFQWSTADG